MSINEGLVNNKRRLDKYTSPLLVLSTLAFLGAGIIGGPVYKIDSRINRQIQNARADYAQLEERRNDLGKYIGSFIHLNYLDANEITEITQPEREMLGQISAQQDSITTEIHSLESQLRFFFKPEKKIVL